jgi:nicotinamide-nucleotide amidase
MVNGKQDSGMLARRVAQAARERGATLATAESCTTGLVAHYLGLIPGVSAVLLGGVVAYANTAKRDMLDVPESLLEQFGAVSEHVALAMAGGARSRFGASLAVAVTGVAGPDGGSAEKPVGLVFIAVDAPSGRRCERFLFQGDREEVVESAAYHALRMVDEALSTNSA